MAGAGFTRYKNPWEAVIYVAIIAILLHGLYLLLSSILDTPTFTGGGSLLASIKDAIPMLGIISLLVSILAVIGIIILRRKIKRIRDAERQRFAKAQRTLVDDGAASTLPGADSAPTASTGAKNARWHEVVEYAESENANDWRHAIMEADILLDELLTAIGLDGESVGEKLKGAKGMRFDTLDRAWGAHKVRNALAHEGSKYRLSHREVRRVVDLYRQVFEEFQFI